MMVWRRHGGFGVRGAALSRVLAAVKKLVAELDLEIEVMKEGAAKNW
jgi:hypothetical protein